MSFFKTITGTKKWSRRSQESMVRQWDLEHDLRNCETLIEYCEKRMAELERHKEASLMRRIAGRGGNLVPLGPILTELEETKAELGAYRGQRVLIQREIEGLVNPTPAQTAARTEGQNFLARILSDRFDVDLQIDTALKDLRQLLEQRAGLSAKVIEGARAVNLTIGGGGLDNWRFDVLLDSLPTDLAARSERFVKWFLGEAQATKTYIVRDEIFTLSETLASPHVYHSGDHVELTDEQAAQLLSEERPDGPSIMTVETQKAEIAETEKVVSG